jgi:subtilisin family serine protease
MVASAGKPGGTTINYPCAYAAVVCVGAIDASYNYWTSTNAPISVNIWAPGVLTPLADFENDEGGDTLTGTSGVAGFVAGVLATFVSWERLARAPGTALARMYANSLSDVIEGLPDSASSSALVNTGINLAPPLPYKDAPSDPAAGLTLSKRAEWQGGKEEMDVDVDEPAPCQQKPNLPPLLRAVTR